MKILRLGLTSVVCIGFAVCLYHMNEKSVKPMEQSPIIKIESVKIMSFRPSISVIGMVSADQGIEISPPVAGIVNAIYFHSGEIVEKGDLLFQLSDADLKSKLKEDLEKYRYSTRQYFRYHRLFKNGAISSSEIDQLNSTMNQLKSQCEFDEAELDKTIIRAPFSGKLGINRLSLGQYLPSGAQIVYLCNLNKLYVDFSVTQHFSSLISIGQDVELRGENKDKLNVTGKIVSIASKISSDTQSLNVRAEIISPNSALLPGMYLKVLINLGKSNPALFIHESAINYSPEGQFVYLFEHGLVRRQSIKTGPRIGSYVEVISGLTQDNQVVSEGQQKLFDGASVRLER